MQHIKVIEGSFFAAKWLLMPGSEPGQVTISCPSTPEHLWKGERHLLSVVQLEHMGAEGKKSVGKAAAWGAAGVLTLGVVGAAAGLLVGGNRTEVTVRVVFGDGRWIFGVTDQAGFQRLAAAASVNAAG